MTPVAEAPANPMEIARFYGGRVGFEMTARDE